jgi:hypothetical protein
MPELTAHASVAPAHPERYARQLASHLDRVMDVVGRHLERFGQRDELRVEWVRD